MLAFLAVLLLATFSPVEVAVIGFEEVQIVLTEGRDAYEHCAGVIDGSPPMNDEVFVVSVVYQQRSALAGQDFLPVPMTMSFTNSNQRICFEINIVDDGTYETNEEFFVNLTSINNSLTLSPALSVFTIEDDDRIRFSWEDTAYTVPEEAGTIRICVILTGILADSIPVYHISFTSITAQLNNDYRMPEDTTLRFFPGGPSSVCYDVEIIPDIAFEGDEQVLVNISLAQIPRVDVGPNIIITIIDYNLITQQQPETDCSGFYNFIINASMFSNVSCDTTTFPNTTNCSGIQCSFGELTFNLISLPCDRAMMVEIRDRSSSVLLSDVLVSAVLPVQKLLRYGDNHFNSTIQAVSSNNRDYFIMSLEFSSELTFPLTAIPFSCYQGTNCIVDYCTNCTIDTQICFQCVDNFRLVEQRNQCTRAAASNLRVSVLAGTVSAALAVALCMIIVALAICISLKLKAQKKKSFTVSP